MALEQGKPIQQSRPEIIHGCEIIEWDAQEGRRIYGRISPSESGMRHSVLRQPVGVVADAFAAKAATIKVGNGLDPENQMGPLATTGAWWQWRRW